MTRRLVALALGIGCFSLFFLPANAAAPQSPNQYKRVHQEVIDAIESGQAAKEEKRLRNFLARYPDDAESYFALSLLLAAQDKPAAAAEQIDLAIERGLPRERFLAGPRELLAKL
ncbi:MAG: hypothetical protein KDA42_19675, partial [Planctomycetales bacterium]|nr:hypothetical protein [Planctomycetales bacterium]